jgi:hypothetical protein
MNGDRKLSVCCPPAPQLSVLGDGLRQLFNIGGIAVSCSAALYLDPKWPAVN